MFDKKLSYNKNRAVRVFFYSNSLKVKYYTLTRSYFHHVWQNNRSSCIKTRLFRPGRNSGCRCLQIAMTTGQLWNNAGKLSGVRTRSEDGCHHGNRPRWLWTPVLQCTCCTGVLCVLILGGIFITYFLFMYFIFLIKNNILTFILYFYTVDFFSAIKNFITSTDVSIWYLSICH